MIIAVPTNIDGTIIINRLVFSPSKIHLSSFKIVPLGHSLTQFLPNPSASIKYLYSLLLLQDEHCSLFPSSPLSHVSQCSLHSRHTLSFKYYPS